MAESPEFCMPRLLREWSRERMTGTFTVALPPPADAVCTVLVENGAVVFATRRNRKDPTGELFLELFMVPEFDGENADEIERVVSQSSRVVTSLFDWPVAAARFEDGIRLTRWPRLDLPVPDLILRGMRKMADTSRVRGWLGDANATFVRSHDPFSVFREPLEPEEAFLLSRFDEPQRVADVLATSGLSGDEALRLVAAFYFAGAIEPASEEGATASAAPPIDVAEAARFWYAVEEKLAAIKANIDYYAILEVERRATTDVIAASYSELAAKFHPERYRHLSPCHVDVEEQLDMIFDAMSAAYAVLTTPESREMYDRELVRRTQESGVRYAVAQPRVSAPLPPPEPEPAPEPEPTPAETTEGAIVDASEASAPPRRDPLPPSTGSLTAADLFRRGAEYFKAGDASRAAQAFERALVLAPDNAKILLMLGRALSMVSGKERAAEQTLLKAASLAPFAPSIYVELGRHYAGAGRVEDARTQLNRALAIDGNHAGAREALAALDRNSSRSFFKKLTRS